MNNQKFYSDQKCKKTALYGQFDHNDEYAGKDYDCQVKKGNKFPQAQEGHCFRRLN